MRTLNIIKSSNPPNIMGLALFLVLLFLVKTASSGSIVKTLPGYDGDLPFKLETGYVGVGENEEVQLFYYFVQSQTDPSNDPLMLWIPGGPSCSALTTLLFENGPITLDIDNYNGGLPKLILSPFNWTQHMNIIFLDGPVGTGFSYSTTTEGYTVGDFSFANHTYEFLQKWLQTNTEFSKNEIYIAGSGYSGTPIPLIVQKILDDGLTINLKGYVLGNPGTQNSIDFNERVTLAHRLALIPDELYESACKNCDYNFTTGNGSEECASDIASICKLTDLINPTNVLLSACGDPNILVPSCPSIQLRLQTEPYSARRYLEDNSVDSTIPQFISPLTKYCKDYYQNITQIWTNNENVQDALHVKQGTVSSWVFCNNTINRIYSHDVSSVVGNHQNFTKTNLQALIYSGDHDISIPYTGTRMWIASLGLSFTENWRAWVVDNGTAGYTERYTHSGAYNLTFATVMGGGHYAARDKVKECYEMIKRWMADEPL